MEMFVAMNHVNPPLTQRENEIERDREKERERERGGRVKRDI